MGMFEHSINQKRHFTGKDGEQTFVNWKRDVGIPEGFDFRVKATRTDKRGFQVWFNVTSWGFYQGSDWAWYFFISYRSSDGRDTVAYHWDSDESGMVAGEPRRHQWSQ